jgi:hypothetical protein
MLTPDQLNYLREELLEWADIHYEEVMDELLDHYASLTEHEMQEGCSFDEAHTKAWIQLGSGRGILHIQERYKKLLGQQMQKQHWAIVRRYFRWPTLVTTLLIGLLTYSMANALSPTVLIVSFLVAVFAPYLLFIPGELRLRWQTYVKRQSSLTSLKREVIYRQARYGNYLWLVFIQFPVLIASFVMDGKHWSPNRFYLFEWHAALSAALTFIALMYALTFVELYWNQSVQRPANA